jgi:soluble lytic murein transglycosylase-like protein
LAKTLAPKLALPFEGPGELTVAETNIRLGILHLADLLRTYRGNLINVFAAYNGSERAVTRWRDRFASQHAAQPHMGEVEFVEEIAYGETKHYVKMLLRNACAYHTLYTGTECLGRLP